jgi:glycosyltransferase involved in cell wall biosynthesis
MLPRPCIAQLIETDGPGGAERVVATLAAALQARGYPVLAMLPAGHEGWLGAMLHQCNIPVERYELTSPLSLACVRRLSSVMRRHNVAVAHSHEFTMAVYGAAAARLAGAAHVITMHGSDYCTRTRRRRLAMRVAARLSGPLACVSTALRVRLEQALSLPGRCAVVPNGIAPAAPRRITLRAELGLDAAQPLLLSVGNLYPVKGHAVLIEALARLDGNARRAHLAIAGRGSLREPLEQRARDLGVASRVHWLGLRDDIPDLLAAANLFVLPSLSEGLPMALLEAMFAGASIVASDVGDVRIALEDGNAGILVPAGDATALAGALQGALDNPAAAMVLGVRARARARDAYHASTMTDRYLAMYERVLPPARRADL